MAHAGSQTGSYWLTNWLMLAYKLAHKLAHTGSQTGSCWLTYWLMLAHKLAK